MRDDWDKTRDGYPSENLCSTIWDDYRPALSIPADFSSMNPAQGMGRFECEFVFSNDSIFYDPPKALMGESAIIKPTLPGKPPADSEATAKPTADPGSVVKPTTPTPTQRPIVETDPPAVPDGPSQSPDPVTSTPNAPSEPFQSPDPGTGRTDVPEEPSQRPDSDTSNVPDRLSDSPNLSTDEPDAPAEPSSPGSGNSDTPEASPNRPPGSTNTRNGSQNENDPAQATAGSGPTQTGSSHNTQVEPASTGVVIKASNGDQFTAIQTQAAGPVVVGSVTLSQGQSTDIDGVGEVVVGSSGLSVGDTFHSFTAVGPAPTPGAIITDSTGNKVTVSRGSDVGDVVAGSSTVALGALIIAGLGDFAAIKDAASTEGFDGSPTSGAFVVAGTTLTAHATSAISLSPDVTLVPGGPAVSVDGQVLSLAPSAAFIVVDGTTQRPSAVATLAPILDIGGTTYTANSASGFEVDGATLTRGGSVVVDGTTVSLDASGGYAVVNGITQGLSSPATTVSPAPTLNIGGTTYTANRASDFIIDGTSLTRGGSVVVDGTTVSWDASGGDIVVNGVTQTISTPATTTASSTNDGTEESATTSTIDGNTDESAAARGSASSSNGGSTPASSACSIATSSPWVKALVTIIGVFFLL